MKTKNNFWALQQNYLFKSEGAYVLCVSAPDEKSSHNGGIGGADFFYVLRARFCPWWNYSCPPPLWNMPGIKKKSLTRLCSYSAESIRKPCIIISIFKIFTFQNYINQISSDFFVKKYQISLYNIWCIVHIRDYY